MNDDRTTLRHVAERASAKHGGVAGRELDRVAKRHGLTLSYTTFDRIKAGTYTSTPSAKTLEALAVLAQMELADVYAAAEVPFPLSKFADQLPPDADLLDGAQREAVLAVVRQFAVANRALRDSERGEERADRSPPNTQADDDLESRRRRPMTHIPDRAARKGGEEKNPR